MQSYTITDEELLREFRKGKQACFAMLVKRHRTKVFAVIRAIIRDKYISEDIFQETFIKVVNLIKEGRYDEKGKFLPWLMRIARNLTIDYYRKAKRSPDVQIRNSEGEDLLDTLNFVDEENHEERIGRAERNMQLQELIDMLPEEQKEVLILRHYGGLKFHEIAEDTGVSTNTVLGRMRYALNNIRKIMAEKKIEL